MPILQVKNLQRSFKNGDVQTHVLKGIDLSVAKGEWVAIMGRSGAGKSTLMYQMSLLDEPTSGEIIIEGHAAHDMSEREKMHFRLRQFGYVFQDYALLPELTALYEVSNCRIARQKPKQ
jgi:putative ABC transport system ATP-binding protein